MTVRRLALVLASLPVLALAGCGSGGNGTGVASAQKGTSGPATAASPSPAVSSDPLKFAQCMREHGIDMKDPDAGGRVAIKIDKNKEGEMREAQKACDKYMAGGKRMDASDPRNRDAMLKFAQCMREHGIDVPDPQPGEGMKVRVPKSGGGSDKFEAAQKACEQYLPGVGEKHSPS
ncbi:hypothetical protein Sme01_50910 [Sphaerisporangium melleum]|uniref:Lipoprotein n=2 Tax=Sphaerisporangium melleum TaxID=321316 RepID=A0A917VFL3_9ACTN|nr:hypothetical protein GCM10007964_17660 [Sphaerisporangium melleum]GII72615.1 hypothetical protein Sme01_50910 [Sphaerisporangium melleum]